MQARPLPRDRRVKEYHRRKQAGKATAILFGAAMCERCRLGQQESTLLAELV
jgi:hypothetical protein